MAILQGIWVSPLYVNGPKRDGDRYGSIKTREYGYISVPADQLHQFQPNKRVCIDIEERGQYKNFHGFANGVPPSATFDGRRLPQRPQQQRRAPDDRRINHQPKPVQQVLPFDIDAMRIFVTGVTGRAIGSGHFQAQDIDELVKEAKAAYMKHMSNASTTASAAIEPELNEPLPDPSSYGAEPLDEEEDRIPY